jgi:hypothetical protein
VLEATEIEVARQSTDPGKNRSVTSDMIDATYPAQSPAGVDEHQWRELMARYDVLQLAAKVAWEALLEAYKPAADGSVNPPQELLDRYQQAAALRHAAEVALFSYIQKGGRMS